MIAPKEKAPDLSEALVVNQLRLLRSERLVAVHVGDCEPMLIKRFLKK